MAKILLDENMYGSWQWILRDGDDDLATGPTLKQSRSEALDEAKDAKQAFEQMNVDQDVVDTDA